MYYQVIPEVKGTVISMFEYSPKNLMEINEPFGLVGDVLKVIDNAGHETMSIDAHGGVHTDYITGVGTSSVHIKHNAMI